jgi:hypothetical protein
MTNWASLPTTDMTTRQFLAALKKLGLSTASQRTARALGVSVRRCQSYAGGARVPDPVARLLAMYIVHGLPPEDWIGWEDEK